LKFSPLKAELIRVYFDIFQTFIDKHLWFKHKCKFSKSQTIFYGIKIWWKKILF